MKTAIVSVGIGAWYPSGIDRLSESLRQVEPELPLISWKNEYPAGCPQRVPCPRTNGYNYAPYCAKAYAVAEAAGRGFDILIWVDAAFRAVRPLAPLIDHIAERGYYFCANGWKVGEWCSDRALDPLSLTREEAMVMPELSSYCIGLDLRREASQRFVESWLRLAGDGLTFPGPHTNSVRTEEEGRNKGFVSNDRRVRGHRHDQTAASVIAWRLGMRDWTPRPIFTDYYRPDQDERTLLVNRGGA